MNRESKGFHRYIGWFHTVLNVSLNIQQDVAQLAELQTAKPGAILMGFRQKSQVQY